MKSTNCIVKRLVSSLIWIALDLSCYCERTNEVPRISCEVRWNREPHAAFLTESRTSGCQIAQRTGNTGRNRLSFLHLPQLRETARYLDCSFRGSSHPHLAQSARYGTKKTGRSPFKRYYYAGKRRFLTGRILVTYGVKAFEKIVTGPCKLVRPGFPARCISQVRVCGFL
jgi:hypothetical protein